MVCEMRARLILLLSMGFNIVLVVMLLRLAQDLRRELPSGVVSTKFSRASLLRPTQPSVVVRRQFFSWTEIESENFQAYIKNLRSIGCPSETIRDLIVAEVAELFAKRRAEAAVIGDQQWWRLEPDAQALAEALAREAVLEKEQSNLLTQLLGPGWQRQKLQANVFAKKFTGAVLAGLSTESKQAVLDFEDRRRAELVAKMNSLGREFTETEVVQQQAETRKELAKLLTADQLEEYLLRHSSNASRMRDQLRGFGTTADEFRGIFRARDALDLEIGSMADRTDPATLKRVRDLEAVRDLNLQEALGPLRYPLYQMTQDPIFREAQKTVEQADVAPEQVLPLYQLGQALQAERDRIQKDATLDEAEREEALDVVMRQTERARNQILGATNVVRSRAGEAGQPR